MSEVENLDTVEYTMTDEAADWFLRIREGLSAAEFRAWRKWLAEDIGHAEAFDRIANVWNDGDRLGDLPWPDDEALVRDGYSGESRLTPRVSAYRRSSSQAGPARYWPLALAASITVAAISFFALDYLVPPDSVVYETAKAEHKTITLPDDSSIILGAESRVVVNYAADMRRIHLDSGEAFFAVEQDEARPFVVSAGRRMVRAIGTAFDVNIGVRDIKVSVVEGIVQIEGPAEVFDSNIEPWPPSRSVDNVSGGQAIDYNSRNGGHKIYEVDAEVATAWQHGRLTFVEMPLESVVADINRYSKMELIIGDQATRNLRFTGTVFHNDVEQWVLALQKAFPLRAVSIEGHGVVLIQDNP